MIKYKIQKNFLDKTLFDRFQALLFSCSFAWFWAEHQYFNDRPFFSHSFYCKHKPNSPHYESFIFPIIKKLKCDDISNIRANCLVKDQKKHFSNFHCDRDYHCTTAILYMNTNNGYTLLGEKEKIKIKSEANKLIIFNSQTKHCAVSQTDTDRRVVVNFNYY